MELQLRWVGSTGPDALSSVLHMICGGSLRQLSAHPGGPLPDGRLQCEASLEADDPRPAWVEPLLAFAGERGDDALLTPCSWRPLSPRLACFDGDMTLVDAETIDVLGDLAGLGEAIAEVTARAMAGQLDFGEALRARVALLQGLPLASLDEARLRIRPMPGAAELLGQLQSRGCECALFSGGFHFLLDPLAKEWSLASLRANRLGSDGERLDGTVEGPIVDAEAKARSLRELADGAGLERAQILAVGDGANDAPMLSEAGIAVGFRPKPALLRSANGIVSGKDLRRLADLLDLFGTNL